MNPPFLLSFDDALSERQFDIGVVINQPQHRLLANALPKRRPFALLAASLSAAAAQVPAYAACQFSELRVALEAVHISPTHSFRV